MGGAWAATSVTTSKPQGEGSSSNPFQISNAKELAWFRDWVNGTYTARGNETATTHPDACAKLTANIDMSTVCGASIGSWTPISDYEAYGSEWKKGWGGKFDGNNKTISNLYIDSRLISTQTINKDKKCQGLFGKAYASKYSYGEIKNIIFDKVSIYVEKSSEYTGTLAGETAYFKISGIQVNSGTIQVSTNGGGIVGDLYNSNIYSSINKVNVTSVGAGNGGICGEISGGEMKKCINYGNITNTNSQSAGGLAGDTDTTRDFKFCNISDCANYGNVSAEYHVGGIVGYATTATIKNCLTTGNITSILDNEYYGMLIGGIGSGKTNIENTFYSTNATLTAGSTTKDIVSVGKKMRTPKEYSDASTGFTKQFLASGLIAYFLESKAETAGTWGQDISSSSKDAYPVLGGKKVYLDGSVSYNCQNTALNGTITNTKPAQEGTFTATPSHQIKLIAQVDAKCSEKGTKKHYQCGMCNKIFEDAQGEREITDYDKLSIPATGIHKPTEVKKVNPTCEAYGVEAHYLCSECNKIFADRECTIKKTKESLKIEILPHQYNDNDVCSMCKKAMPTLEISAITPDLKKTDGVAEGKGGYNLWKYTAAESKNLILTITKESDLGIKNKVSIFDKDFNILTTSGNLAKGSTSINQPVKQGETYYIGITASNPTSTLSISLATIPQNIKGGGIADSPFELATAKDLVWFKDYVNDKSGENLAHGDACAKLTADIDLSTVCGENVGSWDPINNWTGLFDGGGHTISNLYIKDAKEYTGLFGNVGSTEKQTIIRNIVFVNANITNTNEKKSENSIVVAKALNAKISDIHIVSGALIANISIVNSDNWIYSGGIVGYGVKVSINSCTNKAVTKGFSCGGIGGSILRLNNADNINYIGNCINYGNIEGGYAGGIIGDAQLTTINNCANFGNITGNQKIGGIAGWIPIKTKIQNSFTTGNVSLCESHTQYYNIGLVVGNGYRSSLSNIAYSSEATLNGKLNGNAVGYLNDGSSSECTAYTQAQMKSGEVAYKLNNKKSEGDDLAWYQKLGENGDAYPVLTSTGENTVYEAYHHGEKDRFFSNTVANQHSVAYNAEAEDEANGNHDLSYEAGEYTWTEAEDKTQVPSVAVTYTCKVCGKTETPQMTVEHDAEHDDVEATCTEDGHKYYKTSYTFNAKAIFSNAYTQTLPALGHNMSEDVTFNDSKSIYQKGCTRADCDYHDYYATSDGSIEAKPNDDASAFTVEAFTLNDATVYNSKAKFTVKELTYNRTFKHDGWQAVYVPFELECDQIPDDYEVATINNFHEFEQKDGSFNTVLEVKPVKNSITIPALTPCLIRLKDASTAMETEPKKIVLSGVQFEAAADKYIDCSSVTRYYKFMGTLAGKTGFNEASDYAMNAGALVPIGPETNLKPQCWYLSTTDRSGSQLAPTAQQSRIAIRVIGGDETTGIDGIYVKTDTEDVSSSRQGIYDLQGRKLSVEPTSGIYIKDGKKYVK